VEITCVCVYVCDLSLCSRDTQLLYVRETLFSYSYSYKQRYYVIDDQPTVVEKTSYFILLRKSLVSCQRARLTCRACFSEFKLLRYCDILKV